MDRRLVQDLDRFLTSPPEESEEIHDGEYMEDGLMEEDDDDDEEDFIDEDDEDEEDEEEEES